MNPLKPFEIPLSGINLIEASAGTGKTYNIASLYIRALIERDIEVKEILVVTYTEAATKELRDRLMKRLRESIQSLEGAEYNDDDFLKTLPLRVRDPEKAVKSLKKAIRSFDEASIYTIHGFCYQALQEQAFESRAMFDAELAGDDSELIQEVIDDYWRNWVREVSESPQKQPLLKYLMDKGCNPDSLTDELKSFTGKPYLDIQPQRFGFENLDELLERLSELFDKLKSEWTQSREEIFKLLNEGNLSYYRTDWLQGWMVHMHNWIKAEAPPIELFDKFDKFRQSSIDNSLKKSSQKKGASPPQHSFFNLADSYHTVAESLSNYDKCFKLNLFYQLLETLDVRKEERQVLSYDDLLIRLRDALIDSERGNRLARKLRKAYPITLVDEFQDTDPIQYEIFRTVYGEGRENASLFMIGDPKQSIYSFRGADIFAYLKAKEDVPEEQTFSLERNFRSVPELLDAVNHLFGYQENPFILDNIPFNPVKAGKDAEAYKRLTINDEISTPIELRRLDQPGDELPLNKGDAQDRCARDTAFQIEELLRKSSEAKAKIGEENVRAADIAVLVRSHYQASLVRNALRDRGIKSVQYSQDSVFKSNEADQLHYVLKAVAEPVNEGYVKTALATNIMGYTAKDLLQFEEEESAWISKIEQFSKWHDAWQKEGFASMFRQMLKDEKISEKIIAQSNGERKLTNLIHLSELLQQKEKGGKTGTRSLLQWFARKRNEEQKDVEEEQLRLESDENLVKVVTMHRSKGLEYPIVFCPFLWHGPEYSDSGKPIVYHDPKDVSKVYLDFHGKEDPERSYKRFLMAQEELAESVRLAYVAITRAEQKCILSWIHASKTEYSPLGYLLLGGKKSFRVLEGTVSSEDKYNPVKTEDFDNSIAEMTKGKQNLFSIVQKIEPGQLQISDSSSDRDKLTARIFHREKPLETGRLISSFSSLTRDKEEDFEIDYDIFIEEISERDVQKTGPREKTIFSFPRGPKPGTAIHHIFEEIDFSDTEKHSDIIVKNLKRFDIDESWSDVVSRMVQATLNKNLAANSGQLKLIDINPENLNNEMEFYFRSGDVNLKELLGIIRPDKKVPSSVSGFAEEGFLKGFIDLTFKQGDKYYILDYKTNHLGDSLGDYNSGHMESEIVEAIYDLQYHIYILALHRYLENINPDNYSYENQFGGAYYLFLRGINEQGSEGIYFDRPEYKIIDALDSCFKRRGAYE